jgi:hypothetical protein
MSEGPNILPDSRARNPKGLIFNSPMGTLVPVFCANCGAHGGHCPEQNMTFLFYQCSECHTKYGQITGTMVMPDEVFFEKMAQEQLAAHGRYLTELELAKVVAEDSSPLATLIKEAPR